MRFHNLKMIDGRNSCSLLNIWPLLSQKFLAASGWLPGVVAIQTSACDPS